MRTDKSSLQHPYLRNPSFKMFVDTVRMCLRKELLTTSEIEQAVAFAIEKHEREVAGLEEPEDERLMGSALGL